MLTITRLYKNTDGETLRIDNLVMQPNFNKNNSSYSDTTYYRELQSQNILEATDRDVASVSLVTEADTFETSSGNYLWAKWSKHPLCQCDMSDLPRVGDTI